MLADEDRLEVRRQTNEQDKHLDVISDALSDLQRIGEVGIQTQPAFCCFDTNMSSVLPCSMQYN